MPSTKQNFPWLYLSTYPTSTDGDFIGIFYLAFFFLGETLKIEEVENMCSMCWAVWNSHNNIVNGIKNVQASMAAEKVHWFHEDYLLEKEALSYSSQINVGWSSKCNIGNKLWCVTVMGTCWKLGLFLLCQLISPLSTEVKAIMERLERLVFVVELGSLVFEVAM